MYCPKCNQHHRRKYGATRCTCGYRFVFGHNDAIKDRLMWFLEKKASKNYTRSFSLNTLYAVYQKRQKQAQNFFGIFKTMLSKDSFAKIHSRWQSQSSLKSDKFIEKPSLLQPENPIGEEVFNYGIERIIVVDDPLKVDLFIKDNEHINKQALIISSDGYPAYLKPQLQNILVKQPNVPVSFLYQPNQTIDEQKACFEQNFQIKLQDGQVWDMSVAQKSTTRLEAKKTDISVPQKSRTPLKADRFDSIANKSNNVIRIISAGIMVATFISVIIAIIISNHPTIRSDGEKSDIPETRLSDNHSKKIPVSDYNGTDNQWQRDFDKEVENNYLPDNKNVGSTVDEDISNEPNVNHNLACHKLTINAMPSASRIRIMNIKPKYKHGICLKKGNYDIYVTHKNHKSYRKWIKIEDRDVYINMTLETLY